MVPADLNPACVVMGASAGAIEALGAILPALPADLKVPVIVVVHLPPRQKSVLAPLFAPRCALPVRQVTDKADVTPGIWFAPPDYHLLLETEGCFSLSVEEPVNYSRPSIDVFFESAAEAFGERVVAVVLTGANSDGAEGAKLVRERGGFVVAQDPATAIAAAMPTATVERAKPQLVTDLGGIARFLCGLRAEAAS
jgi:two-component system chemotaxis response regulator CheB